MRYVTAGRSGLGMPGVMLFRALGQKPLSSSLAPAGQRGPAGFGAHPRAESMLPFPGPFGRLKSAFHERMGTV
jgi:hypothetical protein